MTTRAERYANKLSGDVRKKRYDAQKPLMVKQEAAATNALVKIETQIKQIVQGEPIILIPYYIIFGKEIYSKQKKFKAQTLVNEIEILEEKWRARGLNWELLEIIKLFYVEAYKNLAHFKLDISFLDGPHVLS